MREEEREMGVRVCMSVCIHTEVSAFTLSSKPLTNLINSYGTQSQIGHALR